MTKEKTIDWCRLCRHTILKWKLGSDMRPDILNTTCIVNLLSAAIDRIMHTLGRQTTAMQLSRRKHDHKAAAPRCYAFPLQCPFSLMKLCSGIQVVSCFDLAIHVFSLKLIEHVGLDCCVRC